MKTPKDLRKESHNDIISNYLWLGEEQLKCFLTNRNSKMMDVWDANVVLYANEVDRRTKTSPKFNCIASNKIEGFKRKDFGKRNWNPE